MHMHLHLPALLPFALGAVQVVTQHPLLHGHLSGGFARKDERRRQIDRATSSASRHSAPARRIS
eukprot:scaffold18793_cov129-Isochrysis_galbana.AAC.2